MKMSWECYSAELAEILGECARKAWGVKPEYDWNIVSFEKKEHITEWAWAAMAEAVHAAYKAGYKRTKQGAA